MGSNTERHCYLDLKAAQVKQVTRRRELIADIPHMQRSRDSHDKIAQLSEMHRQSYNKMLLLLTSRSCEWRHFSFSVM